MEKSLYFKAQEAKADVAAATQDFRRLKRAYGPRVPEEALYKWVAYALISTRANTDQNIVARIKKERFAEMRKAKLRLSNIKLEEITQVLRGKSKQIKH